jgi:DNA methylase/Restriction endonuclease
VFQDVSLTGPGVTKEGISGKPWKGCDPTTKGRHWAVSGAIGSVVAGFENLDVHEKLDALERENLIYWPKPKKGQEAFPGVKQYPFDGQAVHDCILDIAALNSQAQERLGYPTQKPVALLERILQASSNPGDVVLDPFCGCGTTVHAAQKLGRNWIGIDVTHIAVSLIETRLFDAFGKDAKFTVHGTPKDIGGARDFFDRDDRTKKEFEKWACSLIKAYPQGGGKKGADGGIDGLFWFGQNKSHKAIVSVKGGKNVGVGMVRDLDAVVTEQNAAIGVLLTLTPPTKPMVEWAAKAGTFDVDGFGTVQRLQIVTIEEALDRQEGAVDTRIRHADTYKAAPKEKKSDGQTSMDI